MVGQPPLLPSNCVCGKKFTVEHALGCPCGGFPSIRHNELRDITAELLTEVCHCVGVEPTLQPLTGDQFFYRSANVEVGARLDVVAEGFWVADRRLTLMSRFSTPLPLLIVLFHFLNATGERSLRNDRCMKNVLEKLNLTVLHL